MKSKEQKQKAAIIRQGVKAKRTSKEQIEHLDKLLGAGKGAKKERTKLKNGL